MKMLIAMAVIADNAGRAGLTPKWAKETRAQEKDPRREQAAKAEKEQAAIEKEYNATMERTRPTGAGAQSRPLGAAAARRQRQHQALAVS